MSQLIRSSLPADASISMGKAVGVDYYVAKFELPELNKMLRMALGESVE